MNPYASFLGPRNAMETVAQTPARVASLLSTIGEKRVGEAPAPGKWSAREIIAHLADCELVFAFRLRQTLADDNPVVQPFDQDKWAAVYPGIGAAHALAAFTAIRKWNLELLARVLPGAGSRPVTHPERGTMTFLTIVETMAGHDINHLGQLARIAASPVSA